MLAPTSPPTAAPCPKNGLSRGVGAVVVEAQDHAGEVGVVRLGAAELVVGHARAERPVRAGSASGRAGRCRRSGCRACRLAPNAARDTVDGIAAVRGLSGPNDHAAVVVAAQGWPASAWKARSWMRFRSSVQRRAVPDEPVHAVAQQRHVRQVGACRRRCCSPSSTGRRSGFFGKSGCRAMPSSPRSEAELTARSSTVAWTTPFDHALDPAGVLLQHEHVVRAEEGQVDRLVRPVTAVRTARLGSTRLAWRRRGLGVGPRSRPGASAASRGPASGPQGRTSAKYVHTFPPGRAPAGRVRPTREAGTDVCVRHDGSNAACRGRNTAQIGRHACGASLRTRKRLRGAKGGRARRRWPSRSKVRFRIGYCRQSL